MGKIMDHRICSPKRTVVARFDDGDDLLLSLTKCAEENGIKAGSFSLIGALKRFNFGLYAGGQHRSVVREAKNCFEVVSAAGNIFLKEGKVMIHAHVACADEDEGAVFGGHLLKDSIVYPMAEAFIWEYDAVIERAYDAKTNLWPIKFK